MSNQKSQQACQSRLTQIGVQDSFLGRRDETAISAELLDILNNNLRQLEKDISSRLNRPMDEICIDIEKLILAINETKDTVRLTFEQLLEDSQNPRINKQASLALDHHVQSLSRRVRPKMLKMLDRLSPAYKILEKPLQELKDFRIHSTKHLGKSIYLLRCRKNSDFDTSEKSIFEL